MNTSEQTNEFAKAFAIAQGEIKNPAKDAENPHFKSHYADLASGQNAIREPLSKAGIIVTQTTGMVGDLLMLYTRLTHSSGQWIEGEYPVCKFPAMQQKIGADMTYSRRYALFAIVGIAGEDDDAESGTKEQVPPLVKQAPRAVPPRAPVNDSIPFADDYRADETSADIYVRTALAVIDKFSGRLEDLKSWWTSEAPHRESAGIVNGTELYQTLFTRFKDRGLSMAAQKSVRAA